MKVLVTGAGGQVGRAVLESAPLGATVTALTRDKLDISDMGAVRSVVEIVVPDLIINAAAFTAVDKAESQPEFAFAINADGPRHLAQAASRIPGCRLVHISTDYVFDGASTVAYRPEDATGPMSVYGRSKLAGEQSVLKILGSHAVIVRTAWIYAAQGKNFLLTMVRLMRERGVVRVVADQRGSPTSARSIARAIWSIATRPDISGVLHWTDGGTATWYDFAVAIAEEAHAVGLLTSKPEVDAITTAEYPTPARRPSNSVLDTRTSVAMLGVHPLIWRDELRMTIRGLT